MQIRVPRLAYDKMCVSQKPHLSADNHINGTLVNLAEQGSVRAMAVAQVQGSQALSCI